MYDMRTTITRFSKLDNQINLVKHLLSNRKEYSHREIDSSLKSIEHLKLRIKKISQCLRSRKFVHVNRSRTREVSPKRAGRSLKNLVVSPD